MKYLEILFLISISINTFSYAGYNWNNKNKWGAIGLTLLGILVIVYPSFLILTR